MCVATDRVTHTCPAFVTCLWNRSAEPETLETFCDLWKSSVPHHLSQFSSVMSDSLWPHGPQHTRPPCPSPTPGVYSNSCPLSRWCHPTISFSVVPFSSHLQSSPASGFFQKNQFFTSSLTTSSYYFKLSSVLMPEGLFLKQVHWWRCWDTHTLPHTHTPTHTHTHFPTHPPTPS